MNNIYPKTIKFQEKEYHIAQNTSEEIFLRLDRLERVCCQLIKFLSKAIENEGYSTEAIETYFDPDFIDIIETEHNN